MDSNAKQAFVAWCKNKKMSVHSALSLSFVPVSTYTKVFVRKSLAPQHRLYLLTELEQFKLSAEELAEYENSRGTEKKPRIEYIDETIATHFIRIWKDTGRFPELPYCLVISANNNPNKNNLAKKIMEEVISKSAGPKKAVAAGPRSADSFKEPDLIAGLDAFQALLQHFVVNATEEEFESLLKKRKKTIRDVYGFLVPLLDERPFDAASVLRNMKEFFSNQKTTGKQ